MDLSAGTQGELPIPMHDAPSPYGAGGAAGGHVLQAVQPEHGNNSNNGTESPALPSPPSATEVSSGKKRAAAAGVGTGGGSAAVKYRECLKNHAAAMGGSATDGCGEFLPSGEEGSLEALKCSACGCHRNFHRKEVDDDMDADGCAGHGNGGYGHHAGRRLIAPAMPHHHRNGGGGRGLLVTADPYGSYGGAIRAVPPAAAAHPVHYQYLNAMPLNAMHTSESEEADGGGGGGGMTVGAARGSGSSPLKKRFRTKFTPEQKERMLDFAEHVGWRLQKVDEGMVQSFCQEIGVRRRVLKVWMHNNKHNLATKRLEAPPEPGMAPPPPQQQMLMPLAPPPPPSQPGPSFRRGGPSSPPPQMPMAPPSQAGPSFHRVGPSSPPPQMPMAMVSPPPPAFHRGPGSPPPLKLE